MERTVPFMSGLMRFIAFLAALVLVFYALAVFFVGLFDVGFLMLQSAFETPTERQNMLSVLNLDLLHNFALLIVFILIYRVLMRYVERGEVPLVIIVEAGIAGAVFELLFSTKDLNEQARSAYVVLAIGLFAVYAFRYHVRAVIDRIASAMPVTPETTVEEVTPEVAEQAPKKVVRRATVAKAPATRTSTRTTRSAATATATTRGRKKTS